MPSAQFGYIFNFLGLGLGEFRHIDPQWCAKCPMNENSLLNFRKKAFSGEDLNKALKADEMYENYVNNYTKGVIDKVIDKVKTKEHTDQILE